jgi:hypothetical protein
VQRPIRESSFKQAIRGRSRISNVHIVVQRGDAIVALEVLNVDVVWSLPA